MITFDPDDLPSALGSAWDAVLEGRRIYPQLAYYYANRDGLNAQRRLERPSRAKTPALRAYGGVPVVVRRAVRAHVAELRAKSVRR